MCLIFNTSSLLLIRVLKSNDILIHKTRVIKVCYLPLDAPVTLFTKLDITHIFSPTTALIIKSTIFINPSLYITRSHFSVTGIKMTMETQNTLYYMPTNLYIPAVDTSNVFRGLIWM